MAVAEEKAELRKRLARAKKPSSPPYSSLSEAEEEAEGEDDNEDKVTPSIIRDIDMSLLSETPTDKSAGKRKAASTSSKESKRSKRLELKAELFTAKQKELDAKFIGQSTYGELDALCEKAGLDPKELGTKTRKVTALAEAYCNASAK